MRGQIIADFIVEHRINDKHDLGIGYVTCTPWNYISIDRFVMMVKELLLSYFSKWWYSEFSNRSKEDCINNQVEYEALLFGLEFLQSTGVKRVEVFGDSLLMVQQVFEVC